jgi:hypothetical protein
MTKDTKHPHIVDGDFQSDKYPNTPLGKVPLSTKDPTAQDLLYEYAQRRRKVDAQFADDLEIALHNRGYVHLPKTDMVQTSFKLPNGMLLKIDLAPTLVRLGNVNTELAHLRQARDLLTDERKVTIWVHLSGYIKRPIM